MAGTVRGRGEKMNGKIGTRASRTRTGKRAPPCPTPFWILRLSPNKAIGRPGMACIDWSIPGAIGLDSTGRHAQTLDRPNQRKTAVQGWVEGTRTRPQRGERSPKPCLCMSLFAFVVCVCINRCSLPCSSSASSVVSPEAAVASTPCDALQFESEVLELCQRVASRSPSKGPTLSCGVKPRVYTRTSLLISLASMLSRPTPNRRKSRCQLLRCRLIARTSNSSQHALALKS